MKEFINGVLLSPAPVPPSLAPDVRDTIKTCAADRARVSWRTHQNAERWPEAEDHPDIGRSLTVTEIGLFRYSWRVAMLDLKAAHDAFIAYAHSIGDPGLVQAPRFEDKIVIAVLGEVRSKLGALGQSTRLFSDPREFSWEERKPPTRDNHEAYEIAREVRTRVLEAVLGVLFPESLALDVGPVARVEEIRGEPFTAVLVTARSLITKPVTLAVYAERL